MKKAILILTAAISLLSACGSRPDNSLQVKEWQVLYSQAESPDEVMKDSRWQKVTGHLMLQPPYPPAEEIRYFWLKGNITVHHPEKYYGISLGRAYFSDETWLNGETLGSLPPAEVHEVHRPRFYRIDPGKLKKDNEILVRIGTFGVEYGGIHGPVLLMEKDTFIKKRVWNNLLFVYIPLGVLIFFLGPLLFSLILIALKKDMATSMIMVAILIFWTVYLLTLYSPWFPGHYSLRMTILWSAISFMPILFILFIQSYYKTFVNRLNILLMPVLVLCIAITFIFNNSTSPYYPGRILGLSSFLLMLPAGIYLMHAMHKRKPGTTVFYFLFLGYGPIALFIGYDLANYIFIDHVPPMVHVYFLPIPAVLYLILRIKDLIRNEIRLELLYNDLSRKVDSTGKQEKNLTITAEMEQKLDRVMEFIRENYRSDISREGLARAVDVSPDHMSRSFKQYTGKRILDYINEYRVRETEELLKNTDKKIVDIAFEVGFENLVSFNRVFYRITKMTPSRYRSANRQGE